MRALDGALMRLRGATAQAKRGFGASNCGFAFWDGLERSTLAITG